MEISICKHARMAKALFIRQKKPRKISNACFVCKQKRREINWNNNRRNEKQKISKQTKCTAMAACRTKWESGFECEMCIHRRMKMTQTQVRILKQNLSLINCLTIRVPAQRSMFLFFSQHSSIDSQYLTIAYIIQTI